MITQNVTLSNTQEGKIQKRLMKFQSSVIALISLSGIGRRDQGNKNDLKLSSEIQAKDRILKFTMV